MKEAVLTVIVPIFNKEALLGQCLDSFMDKKFEGRLEVLAVDDGSVDSSLSIALEYEAACPGIYRVIGKENGGVGSVMNVGLQNATGKYIKEVDADDYVDTAALGRLLDFLEECSSDIVLTPFAMMDASGRHMETRQMAGVEYGREYPMDALIGRVEFCIQSMALKRKLALEKMAPLAETRYYVDMQVIGESIYYAGTCSVLGCVLYYYRLGQEGQSVSLGSYVKNRESFRVQTMLSLERFCRAEKESMPEIKKELMKCGAYGYSEMLYIIYLMDKSALDGGECRAFDAVLRDRYPDVYAGLDCRHMIRSLREKNFGNMAGWRKKVLNDIEELKIINKGNVRIGDVCALEFRDDDDNVVRYKQQKQSGKVREHLRILNCWFMNYQKGNRIGKYLSERGYRKVAIYGLGMLGERLYQELLDSEIEVAYGMDRRIFSGFAGLEIVQSPDMSKEVDAVIITAVTDFTYIAADLAEKLSCPLISLEDVIWGN